MMLLHFCTPPPFLLMIHHEEMRLNANRNSNSNPKGDRKSTIAPKNTWLDFHCYVWFQELLNFSKKFREWFLFVNGLFIVFQCSNPDGVLDGKFTRN